MPPEHQGFCFTHNNWTPADLCAYRRLFDRGYFAHLVVGKETAPSTGTPHLQGWFWLSAPARLANVKRKLNGAWVSVPGKAKGPDYWIEYCSKQDADYIHLGIAPSEEEFEDQCPKGQGKRTDLLAVKDAIDQGTPADALMSDRQHFGTFAAHRRFFHEYQAHARRRTAYSQPLVTVFYGGTSTAKTRRVFEMVEDLDDFYKWEPQMGQWFDGYCGQRVVLFDEFRGQFPYGMILSLLDGYPCTKVQIKGGTVLWSPAQIYLTSPTHPREWYANLAANDNIAQLLRRITNIVCTDETPASPDVWQVQVRTP